jgi:hypothetical protein
MLRISVACVHPDRLDAQLARLLCGSSCSGCGRCAAGLSCARGRADHAVTGLSTHQPAGDAPPDDHTAADVHAAGPDVHAAALRAVDAGLCHSGAVVWRRAVVWGRTLLRSCTVLGNHRADVSRRDGSLPLRNTLSNHMGSCTDNELPARHQLRSHLRLFADIDEALHDLHLAGPACARGHHSARVLGLAQRLVRQLLAVRLSDSATSDDRCSCRVVSGMCAASVDVDSLLLGAGAVDDDASGVTVGYSGTWAERHDSLAGRTGAVERVITVVASGRQQWRLRGTCGPAADTIARRSAGSPTHSRVPQLPSGPVR